MSLIVWSGVIVILGFVIGMIFILSTKKRRNKRIQHYERIRDELTLRKPKKEKVMKEIAEVEEQYSGGWVSNLIAGFVVIAVGLSILPMMTEQIEMAINESNETMSQSQTKSMKQVLTIFPSIFIIAIIIIVVGITFRMLRSIGLLGEKEQEVKKEIKTRIGHYEGVRDDLTKRGDCLG